MYIDHLTLAGIFVASLYLILPLWFGKEVLRVEEGGVTEPVHTPCGDPIEDLG
jgi:hypothetical protein